MVGCCRFFADRLQRAAHLSQTYPAWRYVNMGRSSELFVIDAVAILGFSLVARFISPSNLGVSIHWRHTAYVLPPGLICLGLATGLCFFATIYSLWMLPFNGIATQWHFWLSTIGIVVFWLSFYRTPGSRTALWVAFAAAPAVVLLTQVIFVWNLIQAILKMPRLQS